MKILKTTEASFKKSFQKILDRSSDDSSEAEKIVRKVLQDVRRHGDRAILKYTKQFDRHAPRSLQVSRAEIAAAYREVGKAALPSLKIAARRIEDYHVLQATLIAKSWKTKKDGIVVGERTTPIERVGIYVPGGLAAYPSTVLMNGIPAQVAGVKEIIMVSPWNGGVCNPYTLVAADMAGIKQIFKIGGAQAIGALAYGTKTVPAVDKIVGPGNIYVATAKRLVFGKVGIDMIAGPTEVAIVADDSAQAEQIASDLLSQAEHDPQALAILITSSKRLAEAVAKEIWRQKRRLQRGKIIHQALESRGVTILTRNLSESVQIANDVAAEHLELQVRNPQSVVSKIKNAGAIFIGKNSPVAFGDYLAGPNHVLPTSGTARFSSPLGVGDFLKRSSLIAVEEQGLKKLGPHVVQLAKLEGLTAHAASVEIRLNKGY
jgi:histidinol dehydrogenase